ncbi:MAG: protein-S-isoprenylcysteine O-methyltransferase Ste14 [Paraglaciecola sp.]|jgi:protein-S-isoprenylcysteine O-methyltransferase Ste14
MQFLELKLPPVLTLLIFIGLAFLLRYLALGLALPLWTIEASPVLIMAGVLTTLSGLWQFRRAHTTIDPTHPDKVSALVTAGIYQYSRNPMYLGMALVLSAAVLKSGLVVSIILLPLFIGYMTRFQIKPEESAIEGIFTEEYTVYKRQVRRWL